MYGIQAYKSRYRVLIYIIEKVRHFLQGTPYFRIWGFVIAVVLFGVFVQTSWAQPKVRKAPEIKDKVWLNAGQYKKPSMKLLEGKVVFVFFWPSDDIGCLRMVPEFNDWYSSYKKRGLEIIGIHFFEWTFKASESNFVNRINELEIKFPVVMDEDASLRKAYGSFDWPSFFLIDRKGFIRAEYTRKGVSSLKNIEILIQALLEEGESEMLTKKKRTY